MPKTTTKQLQKIPETDGDTMLVNVDPLCALQALRAAARTFLASNTDATRAAMKTALSQADVALHFATCRKNTPARLK